MMLWVEKCNNREVGGLRVRRRDTRIWFVVLSVFLAVFLFTFLRQSFKNVDEVEAANLTNFDPGYIISDYQMTNYNSMTEAEIQAFLTAKNPCGNTRQGDYEELSAKYQNIKWHFEDGHFVCLSEELFGDGEVIGEGETAAHIIWQAAQDYQINPQVLIVLIQKEQGLITDDFPNSRQYRSATGYGCPDTAACSEKYYGFKNQVRNAAAMFRTVLNGGWTNYPLGNNYIQYNPSAACGGSLVNVRNLATSALYRYTPYQPNEGALAAGYGTAYCGSYGNRNFYHYFEDWFGKITDEGMVYDNNDYNGSYSILYAGDKTKTIGLEENNVIVSAVDENNQSEKWKIKKKDDYYVIINKETEKMLSVEGGVFEKKTNVVQISEDSCASRWNFVKNADGTVTIHNVCSPKFVLDLQDGNYNVQIYTKTDYENDHQKWILEEEKDEFAGVYNVVYAGNKAKTLSVSDDGNIVVSWLKNEDKGQQWSIERVDDYYIIKNVVSGKVVDISGGGLVNKTNIWQYKLNNSCAQRWGIEKNVDGTVTIYNICNEKFVLDLQDGISNVQIYTKTDYENDHQKWILSKIDETDYTGVYHIVYSGDHDKVLTIEKSSTDNYANALVEDFKEDYAAHEWTVEKIDDYYVLKNNGTGKLLDVEYGKFANKINVWQYALNKTCAQRWQFIKNENETVTIQNACSPGFVLDVQDGISNVQIYTKTLYANDHQEWLLEEL